MPRQREKTDFRCNAKTGGISIPPPRPVPPPPQPINFAEQPNYQCVRVYTYIHTYVLRMAIQYVRTGKYGLHPSCNNTHAPTYLPTYLLDRGVFRSGKQECVLRGEILGVIDGTRSSALGGYGLVFLGGRRHQCVHAGQLRRVE